MAAAQALTADQRVGLVREMSQAVDYVILGNNAATSSAHSLKTSNNQSYTHVCQNYGLYAFSLFIFYFLNFPGAGFILILFILLAPVLI